MSICQIIPSLEERHGGPSKSVHALSRALSVNGRDVDLLSTHPLIPSTKRDGRLTVRVFKRNWPQKICISSELAAHLRSTNYGIVHHHSLWLRTLHYAHQRAAALKRPLVISPRGMMSPWAWNHHGWRKAVGRYLIHPGALHAAAGWHATSSEEADEIRALGFKQPICMAPNGVAAPDPESTTAARDYWRMHCPDVTRQPTALFYSRFHRKKRVLELIDLWLARAPANWVLLMVGLPDDYTAAQLETYVMRSSGGGRIRVYDGIGRPPPYAVASVMLLPSHSENFGLVVAEAMAHGVPPLVTDGTPWGLLNTSGGGWCVRWEDYPDAMVAALAESPAALAERGRLARERVLADFSWEQSALKLADFYQTLPAKA